MSEIQQMAREAMSWLVSLSGLVLALGIAVSLLRQQVAIASGNAQVMSWLWLRLAGLVAGFLLVLLAPHIANALIAVLR